MHARGLWAGIVVVALLEALPARAESTQLAVDRAQQRAARRLTDARIRYQSLPFDPMTFQAPPTTWEDLRDHRLWAAAVVEAVVGMGLFRRDHANQLVHLAEALARHPELNWDVHLHEAYARRLRFQLKEVHGGPYATVVLTW